MSVMVRSLHFVGSVRVRFCSFPHHGVHLVGFANPGVQLLRDPKRFAWEERSRLLVLDVYGSGPVAWLLAIASPRLHNISEWSRDWYAPGASAFPRCPTSGSNTAVRRYDASDAS